MADNLTLQEKIEIIRLRGDNDRSVREVREIFNNRHPERRISTATVGRINKIFNQYGTVSKHILKKNVQRQRPNNERIRNYFTDNPRNSLRIASLDLDLPRETIRRNLKKYNNIKPFKPKFLHTLEEGDTEKRMEYCLWTQGEYENDRNFINKILFSDEATFTTNGTVNSQNSRYWTEENPHWVINCRRQYSQKINVWCGILNTRIIGPFFFEGNLNSQHFLQFLMNEFTNTMDELPLAERAHVIFQLDGCSIHNAVIVRAWLDENFPNRWIGRNSGLVEFPPRSPDLTPLDFFLWGVLKEKVYKTRPTNTEELRERIRQACAEITPNQLLNVMANIKRRYNKCIELNGDLVETSTI